MNRESNNSLNDAGNLLILRGIIDVKVHLDVAGWKFKEISKEKFKTSMLD